MAFEQTVRDNISIIILSMAFAGKVVGGYDIIGYVQNELGVLVSAGTVYSKLYSLERKGLIKAIPGEGKRSYEITLEGKKSFQKIKEAYEAIGKSPGFTL